MNELNKFFIEKPFSENRALKNARGNPILSMTLNLQYSI